MRALIVKTSSLGDVVQAFPVVEYLKTRQAVERIGWVVEPGAASLVRAHPLVDDVIEIDSLALWNLFPWRGVVKEWKRQRAALRKKRWAFLFDLQGNIKSGLVTLSARSGVKVGYGRTTVAEWPNILTTARHMNPPAGLSIREEYLYIVKSYFGDRRPFEASSVELRLSEPQQRAFIAEKTRWPVLTPVWVVAVGSAWPNKMCRTSTFAEVLRLVRDAYGPYFIFVAGTGEELREVGALAQDFSHSSHVLYRPDLPLLQRMMGSATAVLAVDSLILHLASTTATPTFGFFGPSLASKYAPSGARHGFFQGHCPQDAFFEKRCSLLRTCETGFCLKGAEADEMFVAIEQWQRGL